MARAQRQGQGRQTAKSTPAMPKKRRSDPNNQNDPSRKPKRARNSQPPDKSTESKTSLKGRIDHILDKYGDHPLKGLVDQKWPASEVVMAHILNALLSSTRISHDIANATLACLIEENYHDLQVLHESTWQQRTEVLTTGGYTRYREKTATFFGELASLLEEKYDDDASQILPKDQEGEEARKTLSTRLHEIKGLGPMGIDIFLGSIQEFFPNVAPFLDGRSRKTAESIGLGDDIDEISAAVDHSAATMAKLEVALTKIRLEKRENEFY